MFENYSVADLVANIYKKRLVNIVALVLIFCIIAVPYTYKALNSKTIIKDTTNYSSYVSYKITSPLEEQKIIKRNVYPEVPPKVEYSLTELGESIIPVLKMLCEWGKEYQKTIKNE